jgi:hypothetical protein
MGAWFTPTSFLQRFQGDQATAVLYFDRFQAIE